MGTATTTEHKRVDIRRNDTVKVMTGKDSGKEVFEDCESGAGSSVGQFQVSGFTYPLTQNPELET